MDTWSAAGAARELGTNVPRLLRAADRLGIAARRSGDAAFRFGSDDLARLRRDLGVTVAIAGLRRSEVQVLAALARAPLGLRSGRAVAQSARLSPTAATHALRDLLRRGLVEVHRETLAEGRARVVDVMHAAGAHPRWPELAPQLARVRPPERHRSPDRRVPARLAHAFWNAPMSAIDLVEHGPYVARRVLLVGDTQALAWAAGTLTAADWRTAARGRGLDRRQRALAENLAASVA